MHDAVRVGEMVLERASGTTRRASHGPDSAGQRRGATGHERPFACAVPRPRTPRRPAGGGETDQALAAERRQPIGETLLAAGLIDRETLGWALRRQAETGERIGQILLAAGRVHRLDLQRALGEQWQLPFIDLLNAEIDESLVREFDPEMLLAEGWVPVARRRQPDDRRHLRAADARSCASGSASASARVRKSTCAPRRRSTSSARSCSASASTSSAARRAS